VGDRAVQLLRLFSSARVSLLNVSVISCWHASLTFPTILGTGEQLFPAGGPPAYLECLSAERAGAAVLARYHRAAR
jgi:hypothetical protein